MRRKILIGIAALVFLCLIVAIFGQTVPKPTSPSPVLPTVSIKIVTKAAYDRIETGMSYREVVALIGWEGEELSRSELAGYITVMYAWKNPTGSNMNVMFQNDKVVSKAQFGLR